MAVTAAEVVEAVVEVVVVEVVVALGRGSRAAKTRGGWKNDGESS